jgi:SNF2 family DNA or RNA helicase
MSKKILNILEQIITNGHLGDVKHMRIDGNTEICERENICINFNNDPSIFLGLLTTKVGG